MKRVIKFIWGHKTFTFIMFMQILTYLFTIDYLKFSHFHNYLFVVVPLLFTYIFDSLYQVALRLDNTLKDYIDTDIIKFINSCILIVFILLYTLNIITPPINPLFFKYAILNLAISVILIFIMANIILRVFSSNFKDNPDSDAPPDDAK